MILNFDQNNNSAACTIVVPVKIQYHELTKMFDMLHERQRLKLTEKCRYTVLAYKLQRIILY